MTALQNGDPELITLWVAAIQAKLHGIAPGWDTEFIIVLNSLLASKASTNAGDRRRSGAQVNAYDLIGPRTRAREASAEEKYQRKS